MKTFTGLCAAALALLTVTPASAATRTEACQNYQQLESSLNNLRQIGPDSTVGQLRSAEKQVESSYHQFAQSAEPYAKPQTENLKRSVKELAHTTHNIPPSATLNQARAMIKGDIAKVQVARDEVLQTLGCPQMGTPQQ